MSRPQNLTLELLPGRLAVCRRAPTDALPAWLGRAQFFSVTRTRDELSLVIPEEWVGQGWAAELGYRALGVVGPLDFAWVGILADLTSALAAVEVSLFAISTYDTDLILVRETDLGRARAGLQAAGHTVR